ncbi:hypothetical protein IWW39_000006 [Coemansia spiralis]|uniref:Uncharacterized protein n=1 Tax=Coemansia spiralis TaxID=417178 RepID=A0A9W8GQQ7_9FUNG|nr:hypothetical protein IWW39_000006 [Coemansia spiralis]
MDIYAETWRPASSTSNMSSTRSRRQSAREVAPAPPAISNNSQWRQAYVASDTGDTSGVHSTSLGLPDDSRFTTSLAMSEDQPLLAVGSGSHETNMFFVQSLDDQLDVKASFASKFPIYSLALHGNLLLAGTDRSTSVLYRVDRARLLGYTDAEEDGPLVRCVGTFKSKAARSVDVAAPGSHAPTRRVACVDFAGDSFLACVGGVVSVWDASHGQQQQPMRVERVSAQPLTRAVWSPHSGANLIAAAGVDGGAAIVDLRRRGRAVAWRVSTAACANDAAWSPLVPYWLATAGEDGAVRVWDLRYTATTPAMTVRHATSAGVPRRVAWSPTHVDLLSVGTSDRAWRLHSLHGSVVAECRAADDVGAVVAACAKGSTYYTLSACGDLFAHRLTPQALSHAAAKRSEGDSVLRMAETAVYARDIRAAADAVLSQPLGSDVATTRALCDLFAAKPRLAAVAAEWALPATVPRAGLTESVVESESTDLAAQRAMAADLKRLGYGLPPDFPLDAAAARHPAVLQALERLNTASLQSTLDELVTQSENTGEASGSSSWKTAADRAQQIIQCVTSDPTLLDARLLRAVVKLVLPHDCIAGLTLGLGICQAYLVHQRRDPPLVSCGDLDGLVHVLLFPTVFDADSANDQGAGMTTRTVGAPDAHTVRQRIRECLDACPDVVFEMVRLEISIQDAVLKGGEQAHVAEAIVQTMKDHARTVGQLLDSRPPAVQISGMYPTLTTISASAVRLYLNSLVPMRAYDEYLVNSQWWRVAPPAHGLDEGRVVGNDMGWPSSYPLARMINRQTATLVVPRFVRQLDVVRAAVAKEPLSLEPRLYRDTLVKIARINLLMRCDQALTFAAPPSADGTVKMVTTSIAETLLVEAFDEVGNAFLMLLEALARHASHRDAHKRAAAEALPLVESLVKLLEGQSTVGRGHVASVAKYLRKLEHYANS